MSNSGISIARTANVCLISWNFTFCGRTYVTDSTGLANNEDSYTMIPQDNVFKNDRVLGCLLYTSTRLLDLMLP